MRRFPKLPLKEFDAFKGLDSPRRVQDFVDAIRINFEPNRGTCRSPLVVLRRGEAHCIEGAMLAAAALWYHGGRPLLMDLKTTDRDEDHVVALFRWRGRWGAVSKTNHAVLRYRDPVYRSVRELAMSYFNEYFLDDGAKTLRSYSVPFDLRPYGAGWLTSRGHLWDISDALDASPHSSVLERGAARHLRPADPIEVAAGKLVQWRKKRRTAR